jgi:hypothetical protein
LAWSEKSFSQPFARREGVGEAEEEEEEEGGMDVLEAKADHCEGRGIHGKGGRDSLERERTHLISTHQEVLKETYQVSKESYQVSKET